MIIENFEKTIKLEDIVSGNCFKLPNKNYLYMKTNMIDYSTTSEIIGKIYLCVNLETGTILRYSENEKVMPFNAKIIIEKE